MNMISNATYLPTLFRRVMQIMEVMRGNGNILAF
jgi:hypothetical protein